MTNGFAVRQISSPMLPPKPRLHDSMPGILEIRPHLDVPTIESSAARRLHPPFEIARTSTHSTPALQTANPTRMTLHTTNPASLCELHHRPPPQISSQSSCGFERPAAPPLAQLEPLRNATGLDRDTDAPRRWSSPPRAFAQVVLAMHELPRSTRASRIVRSKCKTPPLSVPRRQSSARSRCSRRRVRDSAIPGILDNLRGNSTTHTRGNAWIECTPRILRSLHSRYSAGTPCSPGKIDSSCKPHSLRTGNCDHLHRFPPARSRREGARVGLRVTRRSSSSERQQRATKIPQIQSAAMLAMLRPAHAWLAVPKH